MGGNSLSTSENNKKLNNSRNVIKLHNKVKSITVQFIPLVFKSASMNMQHVPCDFEGPNYAEGFGTIVYLERPIWVSVRKHQSHLIMVMQFIKHYYFI